MEEEPHPVDVRVLIKVIDAGGVEGARPSDDPMDLVALGHKEVGQIGTVLTCDTGDEGFFVHSFLYWRIACVDQGKFGRITPGMGPR